MLGQRTDEKEKFFWHVTVPYEIKKEKCLNGSWILYITCTFVTSSTWREYSIVTQVGLIRMNTFVLFDTNP